jgi:hypothetical protein
VVHYDLLDISDLFYHSLDDLFLQATSSEKLGHLSDYLITIDLPVMVLVNSNLLVCAFFKLVLTEPTEPEPMRR